MLWFLGALLIVIWIIGLAFKVTTGIIHIALIAGLILFIIGFTLVSADGLSCY